MSLLNLVTQEEGFSDNLSDFALSEANKVYLVIRTCSSPVTFTINFDKFLYYINKHIAACLLSVKCITSCKALPQSQACRMQTLSELGWDLSPNMLGCNWLPLLGAQNILTNLFKVWFSCMEWCEKLLQVLALTQNQKTTSDLLFHISSSYLGF